MSFQAYLDTVKAKTGKTPADFAKLASDKGLTKHGELVTWLKSDFELGHGHANAIVAVLLKSESRATSADEKLEKLFSGKKAVWREPVNTLISSIKNLGTDVETLANETYVNVLVGKKKIVIVQPSSAERLDIGIKLKGVAAERRLEAAGSWNNMVTHRVRISNMTEIDTELLGWIKQAYELAR
jgi:predicted transport protein